MGMLRKMLVLENLIEANLMAVLLEERNIPYMLKSYHDAAYDGLFQTLKGGGHIEAPEEYANTIMAIYSDLQHGQREDNAEQQFSI